MTIRRNKYGKYAYAAAVLGGVVSRWTENEADAATFDDATAKAVCEQYTKRPAAGQIAVLDAKGKVTYLHGEPGEAPKLVPVVTLQTLAEEVRELRARVELIEEADVAAEAAKKQATPAAGRGKSSDVKE